VESNSYAVNEIYRLYIGHVALYIFAASHYRWNEICPDISECTAATGEL